MTPSIFISIIPNPWNFGCHQLSSYAGCALEFNSVYYGADSELCYGDVGADTIVGGGDDCDFFLMFYFPDFFGFFMLRFLSWLDFSSA